MELLESKHWQYCRNWGEKRVDEHYISYLAYESTTSRQERTIKRLWIMCIILIFSLLGTNAGWLYYESQMEEVSVSQEIEATADNFSAVNLNTVGGDYYGGNGKSETNG